MKKIFITLAGFIEPELRTTIVDLIEKSRHSDRLHFGVCYQYNNDNYEMHEDFLIDLHNICNIDISYHNYVDSKGGCWARNIAQQFYDGEEYQLQVDAHVRIVKNWDVLLINELEEIRTTGIKKPIISFLMNSYRRDDNLGIDFDFEHFNDRTLINHPKIKLITSDYWPDFQGYSNVKSTNKKNVEVSILYCGFVFSDGIWVKDIENDPLHYYTGEEFALSIRSYTHGYNIFLPKEIYAWHRVHEQGQHKHHFSVFNGDDLHIQAMDRLKLLIENGDLGIYGLGKKRSLKEYEDFAGINIKNKEVWEVY